MGMKICSKCKKRKSLSSFYKNKRTKSGLYSACIDCHNSLYRENKRLYMRRYIKTERGKKLRLEYSQHYTRTLKYKENRKKVLRKYMKKKRKKDLGFRLGGNMATILSISLKGKKAGRKWQDIVGYTLEDLVAHLEKQFDDKMCWENYGSYWHIDHIKPQSLFNFTTAEDQEFIDCWKLSNLQPLEKVANLKKSNFYDDAIQIVKQEA